MIVVLGLPLNVATIILSCISSMLFSYSSAHGPISIPTCPITALNDFFPADALANVHPLLVTCYFISSLWRYLYSCMHILSMIWPITEAISSSSWPILFKVLTLNVTISIVLLHFSNFCFSLSSVAGFSNTGVRVPTPPGRASFYPCEEQCGSDWRFEYE